MMDSIAQALSKFGAWILGWLVYLVEYALGSVAALLMYAVGLLRYLLELVIYPLVGILETIVSNLGLDQVVPLFNRIWNSPIGYFAELFLLDTALTAVLTAYLFRFVIRRLPFIG